jgi:hypothetical protein
MKSLPKVLGGMERGPIWPVGRASGARAGKRCVFTSDLFWATREREVQAEGGPKLSSPTPAARSRFSKLDSMEAHGCQKAIDPQMALFIPHGRVTVACGPSPCWPLDRFSLRAEAHEWKPCQVWPRLAQRHLEIRP